MQARWFSPDYSRAAELGPGLLTQRSVPPTHTAYLPCLRDRPLWPCLSWSLSLAPDPPKVIRSHWGQFVGLLGMGNRCATECLRLCFRKTLLCGHFWGPGLIPQPGPPTSSPSTWCNPSCYYTVVTRPSRGSWCPGSELTLMVYSSFPRAKG